ncbi:unnamed protein product, partial [Prorocentrum cordatum]
MAAAGGAVASLLDRFTGVEEAPPELAAALEAASAQQLRALRPRELARGVLAAASSTPPNAQALDALCAVRSSLGRGRSCAGAARGPFAASTSPQGDLHHGGRGGPGGSARLGVWDRRPGQVHVRLRGTGSGAPVDAGGGVDGGHVEGRPVHAAQLVAGGGVLREAPPLPGADVPLGRPAGRRPAGGLPAAGPRYGGLGFRRGLGKLPGPCGGAGCGSRPEGLRDGQRGLRPPPCAPVAAGAGLLVGGAGAAVQSPAAERCGRRGLRQPQVTPARRQRAQAAVEPPRCSGAQAVAEPEGFSEVLRRPG